MKLQFAPLDDGRKTRLSFNADFKGRAAIADYNPKVREAMGRILDELIAEIETGKVAGAAERFLDLDRRMRASPGYAGGAAPERADAAAPGAGCRGDADGRPGQGPAGSQGRRVSPRNPGSHY